MAADKAKAEAEAKRIEDERKEAEAKAKETAAAAEKKEKTAAPASNLFTLPNMQPPTLSKDSKEGTNSQQSIYDTYQMMVYHQQMAQQYQALFTQ